MNSFRSSCCAKVPVWRFQVREGYLQTIIIIPLVQGSMIKKQWSKRPVVTVGVYFLTDLGLVLSCSADLSSVVGDKALQTLLISDDIQLSLRVSGSSKSRQPSKNKSSWRKLPQPLDHTMGDLHCRATRNGAAMNQLCQFLLQERWWFMTSGLATRGGFSSMLTKRFFNKRSFAILSLPPSLQGGVGGQNGKAS